MAERKKMPSLENAPAPAVAKATEEGGKPAWLKVLVRTRFWEPCDKHKGVTRGQGSLFCVHCHEVMCPHCRHDQPGHRLLKIWHYGYRSVVVAKDMKALGVDVSNLQQCSVNQRRILHLRPMKKSELYRPAAGTPRCNTCGCYLHAERKAKSYKFCSLVCEGKEDVSSDDFSGHEAEGRLKSLHSHNTMKQQVDEHGNEPEAIDNNPPETIDAPPAANQGCMKKKRSFRRRPRKQLVPNRAPFF